MNFHRGYAFRLSDLSDDVLAIIFSKFGQTSIFQILAICRRYRDIIMNLTRYHHIHQIYLDCCYQWDCSSYNRRIISGLGYIDPYIVILGDNHRGIDDRITSSMALISNYVSRYIRLGIPVNNVISDMQLHNDLWYLCTNIHDVQIYELMILSLCYIGDPNNEINSLRSHLIYDSRFITNSLALVPRISSHHITRFSTKRTQKLKLAMYIHALAGGQYHMLQRFGENHMNIPHFGPVMGCLLVD